MARGRMLNKAISHDRDVATLVNELGAEAGLVFTWLIAHLDREGRVHGDPEVIKGLVFPRIAGIDPAIIRKTAARAHELGLIVWYEVDGDAYIAFPEFEKNQVGMRKDREPESSLPAPTSEYPRNTAGNLPEDIQQPSVNLPSEGKGREGNRREKNTKICPVDSDATDVVAVFDHYRKHHPRSHPKPKSTSKEWKNIKARFAEGYSVDDIMQAIDGYHLSPFHLGENDNNTKYLDLELITRTSGHVAKGIEYAQAPPGKQLTRKGQEIAKALASPMDMFDDVTPERLLDAKRRQEAIRGDSGADVRALPERVDE